MHWPLGRGRLLLGGGYARLRVYRVLLSPSQEHVHPMGVLRLGRDMASQDKERDLTHGCAWPRFGFLALLEASSLARNRTIVV